MTKKYVADIPYLIKIWDFDKNTNFDIHNTSANSHKEAYWLCPDCGHEWPKPIKSMFRNEGKCPCCVTHRHIVEGISDIFTLVDGLREYYDFEKNSHIDYLSLTTHCTTEVILTCPLCGDEKKTKIDRKIKRDKATGKYVLMHCQKCSTILNSLIHPLSESPELLKVWDYKKNNHINIQKTSINSEDYAFWKCPNPQCNYT